MELERLEQECETLYRWGTTGTATGDTLISVVLDLIREVKKLREEWTNVRKE